MTGLTRRRALGLAGGGLLALSGAGALLASRGDGAPEATDDGAGGPPGPGPGGGGRAASRRHPVTLPLHDDNPPVASGQGPEAGPLVVLAAGDRLSPRVLESFEDRYGVETRLTTYAAARETGARAPAGPIQPDIWAPPLRDLPQLAAARLIQPLNHDHLGNLAGVLPAFADPYYDRGSRYTAPGYVWTTGILWRGDHLPALDPAAMANPWAAFWTARGTRGRIGIENRSAFEPLALALLRGGVTDFAAATAADIRAATRALRALERRGARYQAAAADAIAVGTELLAYARSADAYLAVARLPPGTPARAVRYHFPADGAGLVQSDCWAIPRAAGHPVLAHRFIDHLLDVETALENFRAVGGQQPLRALTPALLEDRRLGDAELLGMVYVTERMAAHGLPPPPDGTRYSSRS